MVRKQAGLAVLIFLLAFSSACLAQSGLEGKEAPDFSLKDINGKRVKLSDFTTNGPVLLDFWATWCVPCKQALPHLAKIYSTYKDQGFTFIAISTDNTRSVGKVRPYARSQKWDFPVLLDTDNEVLKRYRGNSVPHTVLIDSKGKIVRIWIGYHPGEEKDVEAEIVKLLNPEETEEPSEPLEEQE